MNYKKFNSSSFTHPHISSDLYDLQSSVKHKFLREKNNNKTINVFVLSICYIQAK